MKSSPRRFFVKNLFSLGIAGLLPAKLVHAAMVKPAGLFDNPESAIGRLFTLNEGQQLKLQSVERLDFDPRCRQLRLQFVELNTSHCEWTEKSYSMCSPVEQIDLFLQAGTKGPVAVINQLI